MKPVKLSWILKVLGGTLFTGEGVYQEIVQGVSTDTRNIYIGDLFIPLRGERFNGHEFIELAYAKGAVGCITEERLHTVPEGKWMILVKDTKKALMELAAAYRKIFPIPVVAVTGSVGKTSTKDMMASFLSQKGVVLKTQGNYNNEIGLPLTVFGLEDHHTVAVLEMGMSGFGEIHNLSRIARPKFGVITNIGVSHIEHLGSQQGILKAKSELFDYLEEDGVALLNGDDPLLASLQEQLSCTVISFGIKSNNMYWAEEIDITGETTVLLIHTPTTQFKATVPSIGQHWIYNILPGVIIGEYFGMSISEMQQGIASFAPSGMRMEKESTDYPLHIINDTYNASPDSMRVALDVLCRWPVSGRRIAILGDMFELGDYSKQIHESIGRYAAQKEIDVLIFVGEEAKQMDVAAKQQGISSLYFPTKEELQDEIPSIVKRGDTILLKASRGMHLEETVEKLKEVK
ncbi:MAG: UDP-N-acetylmuramoyl-tripeptide--D-alanyl-D-alanine ligase [Epulopiscium sp.]|nr:UDP-N-acetylmuramoyl-tripeptide--D-alanyl-D-alanine ligase [Candidatus Epulonipiscium sp.]